MGRRRGFTPTARGFTLIELLVVIAIIGILAGMLFPVFANAREKARQTACMASIKQLAIAVMMYAEDNGGGYVPATDPAKEDPDTGVWYTLMRWHGRRVTPDQPFDPTLGPLWEYLRSAELTQCRSLDVDTNAQGQFELGTGGYGYNAQYVGGSPAQDDRMYVPAQMGWINDPANTVIFTDTANLNCDGTFTEYSFCEAPYYEAWGMLSAPTTHFRHTGFTNVAFCDGHSRPMRMVYTQATGNCPWNPSDGRYFTKEDYEKANLGYLSEDNSLYDRQ